MCSLLAIKTFKGNKNVKMLLNICKALTSLHCCAQPSGKGKYHLCFAHEKMY